MTVQIFVYNCVFCKKEKQHSPNISHENEDKSLENEDSIPWRWRLESLENEICSCRNKWKVINPFYLLLNFSKKISCKSWTDEIGLGITYV